MTSEKSEISDLDLDVAIIGTGKLNWGHYEVLKE